MLQEKTRERNARIRRHENIRMANQNHPVFMGARIRKEIERLLRGDTNFLQHDDGEDNTVDAVDDDAQEYVEHRLCHEGFTKRQSRSAFDEVVGKNPAFTEDEWEKAYEACLQWLLVHLNEDQLPEGFDPRGRTLDVVVPDSLKQTGTKHNSSGTDGCPPETLVVAAHYGLTVPEANELCKMASRGTREPEDVLWEIVHEAVGATCHQLNTPLIERDSNVESTHEEVEALQAIFGSDFSSVREGTFVSNSVMLKEWGLSLCVVVEEGLYPSRLPEKVLLSGKWTVGQVGTSIHYEIAKFLSSFQPGEPVFFEIHGLVLSLLQNVERLKTESLVSLLDIDSEITSTIKRSLDDRALEPSRERGKLQSRVIRRARERSPFWSKLPTDTRPAVAHPNIPRSLNSIRRSLPAASARTEFLRVMREADKRGRVVLVTGDTGCGKTTQIPQFILEESPNDAKIVVCQPRRLAATGVATRVAEERGEQQAGVGSVGYVVRGDSAMGESTRLLFCTTGVLLRQLQTEGALDCITHVVVDEVHERHLDTDVLLGLLKQSIGSRKNIRVILMSATLDAGRFAAYFGENTPRIHIPGRTYPVKDYMLEDVLLMTGYIPRKQKKRNGDSSGSIDKDETSMEESNLESVDFPPKELTSHGFPVEDLVRRIDETLVDYDMLGQLVKHLIANSSAGSDGSILVFLAGAPEINRAQEAVKRWTDGFPLLLLQLHGGLQPREQNLVFKPAATGLTKVILSTNVAETSITIPDCTIVIDSAREKQSSYDAANRMPLLLEQFCSKASLKQRRGRAGRVRDGKCYKLISRSTYDGLRDHGEPEIQRCALDQTLLTLLFLGVESSAKGLFMESLLDPPSKVSFVAAIDSLRQLGAIATPSGEDLKLTPLGTHLAGIPAPPMVGKILILGSILGCREAALAMAAAMSVGRSPFLKIDVSRKRGKDKIDERAGIEEMKNHQILEGRRNLFTIVGNSDHALLASVFLKWKNLDSGGGSRKRFCDSLGLSIPGMRDMLQLSRQLDTALASIGYISSVDSDRNGHSWRIIRTCAVAAMSPAQLVKVVRPATVYHETAEGAREKDGQAKELKFYVRTSVDASAKSNGNSWNGKEERVFMHPSSSSFATCSYGCPWLVYFSLVRTSKAFLRDVTECSAYALLLFGGKLDVQASKGVIVVDGWAKLSANARIGSLVGGLRLKVDELLEKKAADPSFDVAATKEMQLIVKLVVSDGLGI